MRGAAVRQGLRTLPAVFALLPVSGASISTGSIQVRCVLSLFHQQLLAGGTCPSCDFTVPTQAVSQPSTHGCIYCHRKNWRCPAEAAGSAPYRKHPRPAALQDVGRVWRTSFPITKFFGRLAFTAVPSGGLRLNAHRAKLLALSAAPIQVLLPLWLARPLPVLLIARLAAGQAPCPAAAAAQP